MCRRHGPEAMVMSIVGVTFCVACHKAGREELDDLFRPGREAAALVSQKLEGLAELTLPKERRDPHAQ